MGLLLWRIFRRYFAASPIPVTLDSPYRNLHARAYFVAILRHHVEIIDILDS
jgi:hypothetical protein